MYNLPNSNNVEARMTQFVSKRERGVSIVVNEPKSTSYRSSGVLPAYLRRLTEVAFKDRNRASPLDVDIRELDAARYSKKLGIV